MANDPTAETDITRKMIEEQSAVTDANKQAVEEQSVATDVNKKAVEEQSAATDVNKQAAEEQSAATDVNKQAAEEQSAVIGVNTEDVEEQGAATDVNKQAAEEQSCVTDVNKQAIEEQSAVIGVNKEDVEQSAVTDGIQQTDEGQSAVAKVTHQNAEEPIAVIDITQENVEEPIAVIDITQENVEEPIAVIDITQQNVEESIAVIDISQQNVEEPISVIDITQLDAEKQSDVADISKLKAEEPSSVTNIPKFKSEEPSAATDIIQPTTEERSAVADITQQAVEESSAVTDITLQTIPEQSAVKDHTREKIEVRSVARDITQQKFGYVKVYWEIENFFFATENAEWEISSPEFDVEGFFVTRWRLLLKVKKSNEGNNRDAYICLERLEGENDTKDIRVCWNVWYKIAGQKLPLCDRENLIKSNCLLAVPIKNFELLERSLQAALPTSFCVEGLILVRSTENGIVFKRSEDLGVKKLSEEISMSYSISQYQFDPKYDSFSDLKINTEGYPLICHKPILSARNKTLNKTIDKNSGKSEIDLSFSKGKAGRKIFQYLYSGNLTHILRMPSISIDKAINYLGIEELKTYYLKDSIHLLTRFEAEEMYFNWIVMDINSSEKFLSPIFSREKSGLAFRLHLGLSDCPETPFFNLKLDVIEGNKIAEFYFITGIANRLGQIVNRRAMKWSSEFETVITNFTSKSVLSDSSITGSGYLTIVCSIFIPKGTKHQSIVKIQKCLRPEVDHEKHYRLLSNQLNTLFETGKHSDLIIECGKDVFNVHKCVLFVRSPVFRRAIREMRNLEGEKSEGICMNEFDPNILRIILRYVYSGILDCKNEEIFAVYKGSKSLSMVTLQNQSCDILLNNLDVSNAIETLIIAVENADFRLVDSVCRFMKTNIDEIKLQSNWGKFIEKKDSLYEKLKDSAREHLKVYENV